MANSIENLEWMPHGRGEKAPEQSVMPGQSGEIVYWSEAREYLNGDGFENLPRYLFVERKEIADYPRYWIYEDGRVWAETVKGKRFLKLKTNRYGYKSTDIQRNDRGHTKSVHRLVAEAFIPNPGNKPMVNHKRGIKTDNRVCEIEWATAKENIRHAVDTGLMPVGEACHNAKLSKEKAIEIYRLLGGGVPQKEIAKLFNVTRQTISRVKQGACSWGANIPGFVPTPPKSKKLNNESVLKIKKMLADGNKTQDEIARIFNVCQMTISFINTGFTWKHVSEAKESITPMTKGLR
jgi:DNA-binding CsgD family transcriptional regulator